MTWIKHHGLIFKAETFFVLEYVHLCIYIHIHIYIFPIVLAAVKQLKETVSSSIHKLANFDGKSSVKFWKKDSIIISGGQTLMFAALCVSLEVMDAHLQNNQTAEDILDSPDRLKSKDSNTRGLQLSLELNLTDSLHELIFLGGKKSRY